MPKHIIIWSDESLLAFDEIVDFIFEKWGIIPVLDFQNEINRLIFLLGKNKKLCPKSKTVNIRKCVISEQTSLIYKIEGNLLEIITFIDNRSKHHF
ncbi:MAG: type II toxin-antitoxin system RelE/ParE family toxin [Fluviicola sp.]|jgi:plasmid stabilization system protein ParE